MRASTVTTFSQMTLNVAELLSWPVIDTTSGTAFGKLAQATPMAGSSVASLAPQPRSGPGGGIEWARIALAPDADVAIQQALERYECSLAWCRVRQRLPGQGRRPG
jgi:hypothetical protein